MYFLINLSIGIAIGAGAILPGISSGVLCVIFGIYEKLLNSILGFFKDFKKNFLFLFPLLLGSISGIILFGNILNYLLYSYPIQLKSIFIGLIIGSIPSLLKKVNKKSKFSLKYLIFFFISFTLGILLIFLENKLQLNTLENYDFFYLIVCGMAMSIGVIVPGVSSTIILMLLGVYHQYLYSVANVDISFLIPLIIGLSFGSLICMIIIKKLLDKFYAQTFYSIIGFTLGSIFILFPGINDFLSNIISILCIILGIQIIHIFPSKKENS